MEKGRKETEGEGAATRQNEDTRPGNKDEKSCTIRGVLGQVIVCSGGIYAGGPPAKMTQCLWAGDPQEKPRCIMKDRSKSESGKGRQTPRRGRYLLNVPI